MSGATDWYNFSTFARDGAVVIAPNYRLGPLGFMATKELSVTSDTHASGNYGLMDCEMAVHWAKENAAAFGGNPNKITIMGQSSGTLAAELRGLRGLLLLLLLSLCRCQKVMI